MTKKKVLTEICIERRNVINEGVVEDGKEDHGTENRDMKESDVKEKVTQPVRERSQTNTELLLLRPRLPFLNESDGGGDRSRSEKHTDH